MSWHFFNSTGGEKQSVVIPDGSITDAKMANHTVQVFTATGTISIPTFGKIVTFSGSSGQTLTLPTAATGMEFEILNIDTTDTVTITRAGSDTINGATTLTLLAGDTMFIACTATNVWRATRGGIGRLVNVAKILNGTTSYTPTSGVTSLFVEAIGGGGGGGGATNGANVSVGGGGGAGGYAATWITSAATSYTVAVGAGGAAGGGGGSGGTTTFGASSVATATGGSGGTGAGNAAAPFVILAGQGGAGTVGDFLMIGASGQPGVALGGTGVGVVGGAGGPGPYGAGGAAVGRNTTGASAGLDGGGTANMSGGGGSGAAVINSGSAASGGAGSNGLIRVWEYV